MPVHSCLGTDARLVCPTCGEVASSFLAGEGGAWHAATLAPCGHQITTNLMEQYLAGDDVLSPVVLAGARLDALLLNLNQHARLLRVCASRLRAGERACDCDDPAGCSVPDWPPEQFEREAAWWADAALHHLLAPELADQQPGGAQVTPASIAAATRPPRPGRPVFPHPGGGKGTPPRRD
jgi:hypothetical protein